MKWLWLGALVLLAGLQYRLWVGEGSLAHVAQLKQQIAGQERENEQLLERNRVLTAEVITSYAPDALPCATLGRHPMPKKKINLQ